MPRLGKGHSRSRIANIIIDLRAQGEEPSIKSVTARLRAEPLPGRKGLGCSLTTVYRVFDEMGVAYRRRLSLPEAGIVGNPLAAAEVGDLGSCKPSCVFCRFWRVSVEDLRNKGYEVGMDCRRYAPQSGDRPWPFVAPHHWCGEFVENPAVTGHLHINQIGLLYYAGKTSDPELLLALAYRVAMAAAPADRQIALDTLVSFSLEALTTIKQGCAAIRRHYPLMSDIYQLVAEACRIRERSF